MKELPTICGFNKCTEAGIDIFAPSIFLRECNLRCPYCMNAALVTGKTFNAVPIETIRDFVKSETANFVMISGGEPTCTDATLLMNLIEEIKSWECVRIGMSTNGANREALRPLLAHVNYVALDIKTSKGSQYSEIGGDMTDIILSKSFLTEGKQKRKDFDYEIRTTLYPPFIDTEDLDAIGQIILRHEKWVLQQFRQAKNMIGADASNVTPYDDDKVKQLISTAKKYSDIVLLRYV